MLKEARQNRQSQYDHSNEGIPLSRKLLLFRHVRHSFLPILSLDKANRSR
jgi:hypothetical protein